MPAETISAAQRALRNREAQTAQDASFARFLAGRHQAEPSMHRHPNPESESDRNLGHERRVRQRREERGPDMDQPVSKPMLVRRTDVYGGAEIVDAVWGRRTTDTT